MKGEPPPVPHNNPDDANREWARNIIHHLIVDNNDNTNLPTVNIVFEHDTIPIISTINNYSNNLNYIDENYNVKLPDDIFITKNDILNTNYRIYGSIMTEEISSKHDKLDNNNPPQTSYILPTKNNQVTTSASQTTQLHDHISTAFNTTHRGIYKFQINTQIQNDSGANRSVTNLLSLLHNFKQIDPYPIGGINSETPAIYCTGFGYLKWHSEDKQVLHVPCYYCAESSGTIISPTDIVYTHMDNFSGWQMTTNIDTKTGTFILLARDGVNHIKYPTFMKNNLWYHYLFQPSTQSAGYDMYSAHTITIPPKTQQLISTDVAMAIPMGYFGMLKLRSGLALKNNIHVQAGIIDSDYRGEIKILLINESNEDFQVKQGMRIAQLIILHSPEIDFEQVKELTTTSRNIGGFGSLFLDVSTLLQCSRHWR